MKLSEFLDMVNDPVGDVVSVYDTTPSDPYHTLYEGVVEKCPKRLLDRNVCNFYPALVNGGPGACVYLDGYDGLEEERGMKKREVTRVVKVNYTEMSDKEILEVPCLCDLKFQWSCTTFDEGDGFICLKDLDEGSDGRDYAVYLKSSGNLLCLLCDSSNALDGYEDSEYGMERNILYKKIAMLAGWPESMYDLNVTMTWRQFIAEVQKVPKEFLDTPAYAWRPDGGGTLAAIRGVRPWLECYDGTVPGPGGEDDNCYYIDNGFPNEE